MTQPSDFGEAAVEMIARFEPPKGVLGAVTKAVYADEPCFLLTEENRLSKSGKTWCRYQRLRVVRNDTLVDAYIYLGKSQKFDADQFQLLGGTIDSNGRGYAVHTVAELQAGADELRNRPPNRDFEPLPLQDYWNEQADQKDRFKNRPSTYGYGGSLVRP
jgi:hypothetical protein